MNEAYSEFFFAIAKRMPNDFMNCLGRGGSNANQLTSGPKCVFFLPKIDVPIPAGNNISSILPELHAQERLPLVVSGKTEKRQIQCHWWC